MIRSVTVLLNVSVFDELASDIFQRRCLALDLLTGDDVLKCQLPDVRCPVMGWTCSDGKKGGILLVQYLVGSVERLAGTIIPVSRSII
jgi:hypothetical protein